MARKPKDQVLRPALFGDPDKFDAPVFVLHPTLAELREQNRRARDKDAGEKTRQVKRGDLARFLAAMKTHFEMFGHVRPEHQSTNNAPVPVEIITLIGELLAGEEQWAAEQNAIQTKLAEQRKSQLQRTAERIWERHPTFKAGQVAAKIVADPTMNAVRAIPRNDGKTRLMRANTIRRIIRKPSAK